MGTADRFSREIELSKLYQFLFDHYQQIREQASKRISIREYLFNTEFREYLVNALMEGGLENFLKKPVRLARAVRKLFSYEQEDIGVLIDHYNRIVLTGLLFVQTGQIPFFWDLNLRYGERSEFEDRAKKLNGKYLLMRDNSIMLTKIGWNFAGYVKGIDDMYG